MPWSAVTASSTLFWRQTSARRPSGTSRAATTCAVAVRAQVLPGAVHRAHIHQHEKALAGEVLDGVRCRVQGPGIVSGVARDALGRSVAGKPVPPHLKAVSQARRRAGAKARYRLVPRAGQLSPR